MTHWAFNKAYFPLLWANKIKKTKWKKQTSVSDFFHLHNTEVEANPQQLRYRRALPILKRASVALPFVASFRLNFHRLHREYGNFHLGCIHLLAINREIEEEGGTELCVFQISAGREAWRGCCCGVWLRGRSSQAPTDHSLCPAERRNTLLRITK